MLELFIDGDACPVKDEVFRVAGRHGLKTFLVSNQWLRIGDNPLVEQILVGQGADVADDWIAERIDEGDVVITSDIPLAARCLEKGASALAPTGKPFSNDSIGMALAMRGLMADLREAGEVAGGPAGFSKRDRSNFLNALEAQIQTIKRR